MREIDQRVLAAYRPGVGRGTLARELGVNESACKRALQRLRREGLIKALEFPQLPSELPSASELLERRKGNYARLQAAYDARRLIPIQVNIDGPIGIAHMGDPHVDDDGCDIAKLERHVNTINATEGLFGASVGDYSNNWTTRLAHLYGQQSTSAREAWLLVEWLLTGTEWLYLVGGNHDAWQQGMDVIHWMVRQSAVDLSHWGTRVELNFPNGKKVRVNARHDFRGRSQYNPVHGVAKAFLLGFKDHILIAGHTHVSGHNVLKDPSSGLISHCLRVAGYKTIDAYAIQEGFPDANVSPAFVTIIDPKYADDDPRLITTIYDVEEAAEYLTWKRSRY